MNIIPTDNKSLIIRAVAFVALLTWAFISAPGLIAQATGEGQGEKTEQTEEGASEEVKLGEEGNEADALASAGEFKLSEIEDPAIWILLVLGVVTIAVGFERLWVLMKTRSDNAAMVQLATEELMKNPETGDAVAEKMMNPRYGVEGRIAAVALKGWQHDEETMREYAHSSSTAEKRFLEKRMWILSTIGNNAPFIGLLGTVLGIMKAFRDLASATESGPQVVMKGISEALIATATGLAVAIPAVMLFNYFATRIKTKLSNADEIVSLIAAIRMATRGGVAGSHHPHDNPINTNAPHEVRASGTTTE